MPDEPRVQELLAELSDQQATPEEVCSTCLELLPLVRERWRQICRARAKLDALLPISTHGSSPTMPPEELPLPQVPGYEVESVLGCGGMGVVYRARHLRLGRHVALKMTLAGTYAGLDERERFRREAEAVAALRHPNLVQVYDAGDWAGRPYFTMELIEGGSLAQRLAGTPQPARQAAALLTTLAGAVQAAHDAGVVHRDLKPGNVLLTRDGTPKIADFGLARRLDADERLTLSGAVIGTPSYTAPEQARGDRGAVGPRTDVYALGAILYEFLTGRPPFRAGTAAATLQQVVADEPVAPRRLNPSVPVDMQTICMKCLSKEPARRYASALELANDLGRFQAGAPIRARPVGAVERTWKWAQRRPALAALLGVVLLALVGLSALSAMALDREQKARQEADKANKARDFLVSIFELSDARNQTSVLTPRQILDDAEQRIPKEFAGQPDLQAELQAAIDRVYAKITENAPLAMILEAGGGLQLESTRDARQRPVPQTLLYAGDRLTLGEDGQVRLVVLSDLHQEWLGAGREVTVSRKGCMPADVVTKQTDDVLMTFVRLPKGTFYMGWDGQKKGVKTAITEDFEIAVHDVTQGQWQAVMGDCPSYFSRFGRGRNEVRTLSDEELKLLPVEGVSWSDTQEFIRRLNEKESGRGNWYRLPTDAEWEYACRGGATSEEGCSHHFYFDKPTNDLSSEQANFDGNLPFGKASKGKSLWRTSRVGTYPSNHLGLCDMHGNVWQWTDTIVGSDRVNRGGSWEDGGTRCRTASRNGYSPATRGNVLGFRLVRVHHPGSGSAKESERAPQGEPEAFRVAWEKLLERDPPDHESWYGYAELCLFLGREGDYRRARLALLKRFGATTSPFEAERTARACLLLPGTDDELRQAVALAERAVADRGWAHPYFDFVYGLAKYRQGQFDKAIATMRGDASRVLGPAPRIVLAMSLHRSGQATEARKTLTAAILAYDWRAMPVRGRDQDRWINHILRREAEAMILPASTPIAPPDVLP
jgi:formylglycine-generating enzyme required for sulfatase activity/tRNA A-37 threonylcarbamoyl transferase component Bud32